MQRKLRGRRILACFQAWGPGHSARLPPSTLVNFLFVLDGDRKGRLERDRYIGEFGIPRNRIATIDELVQGVTVIEDLLDGEALNFIQKELTLKSKPSKDQ